MKINLNGSINISNPEELIPSLTGRWVQEDTAVLVIHGIGDQNPLETLDGFARGLVETYQQAGYSLKLEHRLAKKAASDSKTPWFDNYIHISQKNEEGACLDIYEYYWAPETEGKATLQDLYTWLENVTRGARKFYKNNVNFAVGNKDESVFINNGEFKPVTYWFFIRAIPKTLFLINWLSKVLFSFLSFIPVIGHLISVIIQSNLSKTANKVVNILNDITVYNTTDAKSKFFKIRNCILDGAVDALRYLLEARPDAQNKFTFQYNRVLLAGHSLGSQIAFDAINRINHLVNQNEIKGYDSNGLCNVKSEVKKTPIYDRLIGLVTFGSPLDKIAFFFREHVPQTEYLRAQIMKNFHGFKQRDWVKLQDVENGHYTILKSCQKRLFENIPWRNYWDRKDYVSGSLDFYEGVTNVNCGFPYKWHSFTHSRYWACKSMFAEVIDNFLTPLKNPPMKTEKENGAPLQMDAEVTI